MCSTARGLAGVPLCCGARLPACSAVVTSSLAGPAQHTPHRTTMTEVDPAEVAGLSLEDVEEREVYEEAAVDLVNSPGLLDFLLGGGAGAGGRVRATRAGPDDPVVEEGALYGQQFEQIRAECLEAGELWTDPEFPPDSATLFYSKVSSNSYSNVLTDRTG